MSANTNQDLINIRRNLLEKMTMAGDRYVAGKEAKEKKQRYLKEVERLDDEITELKTTANHLTKVCKNIKAFAAEHKENAKEELNKSIYKASLAVPDANAKGAHLHYGEDNKITIRNGEGRNINVREGGAYRTLLGIMLRYASLKAQPDALQIMMLDEAFSALSDITGGYNKDLLEEMKKDVTIICIEQRRNMVDGLTNAEYAFIKGEDAVTRVTKTL